MSSILRALKKLEDENTARQARTGWPQGVRPYTDLQKTRESWRPIQVTAMVLLLATGLAGGWWLWQDKTTPRTTPAATSALPLLPTPAPLTAEPPNPMVVPLDRKPQATASLPKDIEQKPRPEALPKRVAPFPPAAQAENLPGHEKFPEPSPVPPVAPTGPTPDIMILDIPEFALQAIAWSENPQKRVAIIGNRIIKEGEKLNEFKVIRINPDDILVRRDTTTWKVVFKNR